MPSSIMGLVRKAMAKGGCWWHRTPLVSPLVHVQPRVALAEQRCLFPSADVQRGKGLKSIP